MAKLHYSYLSDLPVDVQLTIRELDTLLSTLKDALSHKDSDLTRYSSVAALYDELSTVVSDANSRIRSDLEFHDQYSVPRVKAHELIQARTEKSDAA
jgi:hypothetical protein